MNANRRSREAQIQNVSHERLENHLFYAKPIPIFFVFTAVNKRLNTLSSCLSA
jgi:hypothetical protein